MKYLFILIKSKYFNALFSAYNYSINIEYINKLLKNKQKQIYFESTKINYILNGMG